MKNMKAVLAVVSSLSLGMGLMNSAQAIELRNGFGGPAGYGQLSQLPNDDGSSSELNLPFALNFYGRTYSKFYVNNNGNISFNGRVSTYTPDAFPNSGLPMIAPFWGDVDTRRQPGGGAVYTAAPNENTLVVTWNDVGRYSQNNSLINDFQLTLVSRPDTGAAGNFDIEFRYRQLQWTQGSVSAVAAQAGYDAGDNRNYFTLPGSRTSAVLDLATTSNVSTSTPGLWTMAIRNGETSDGSSANAPLLPQIVNQDGFNFNFNINLNQRIFIDPLVAVGYEYRVTSGPNILTALFPTVAGDTDGYQIYALDGTTLLGSVLGGGLFDFGTTGVSGFRLVGIDVGANLDPTNTTAFITGLTFASAGNVAMTQNPITVNTDGNNVPEPSTMLLSLLGLIAVGSLRHRRSGV